MFGGKCMMKSRIVVSKIRSKMAAYLPSQGMQIHMNKNRSIFAEVNSLQNAGKVLSITLNIQESFYIRESLGKLLQSGKGWESFLSFVYQERFQKQQERFCQSLSKSGKAFKNSGKGFFPKFLKITLGKERERKAFSPSDHQEIQINRKH